MAGERGIVVYACSSHYVVETYGGYVLLEWYGGADPVKGEGIFGDLHSYGFKDLVLIERKSETRAWIDDYLLSRDSVLSKLRSKGCS